MEELQNMCGKANEPGTTAGHKRGRDGIRIGADIPEVPAKKAKLTGKQPAREKIYLSNIVLVGTVCLRKF